ncbi:adp-ribose pyrophosphatase [Anaeramoeba flamelloides]|uniref:Adp-ribose pyrophosphatase n=1 Tax=Anaeramoeba flamelloides TaxID=1746091 RepID=A0AAV8A3C1_9EUKA|nr:adp-ribose pyrophosphatase [Anaeramoeba flamelloides]|eukprot:Anaeramoba_flamelloidesa581787_31.p1 GENE.a581787_31~~a581787_31.p1  ORF type:complete len:163 (-),score=35.54 a581787_31:28-495(-)
MNYKKPSLTVDALVYRKVKNEIHVLVIRRSKKSLAFPGCLATCGGFIDYGEAPEVAVLRELVEETGLVGKEKVELVTVKGKPDRDPRGHTISIVYHVELEDNEQIPQAGDDAIEAFFINLLEILQGKHKLAFDHLEIYQEYYQFLLKKGLIEELL